MAKLKKPGKERSPGLPLSDFEGPEFGATAELIRELANLLQETGLGELEIEDKNIRVRLTRDAQHVTGFVARGERSAINLQGGAAPPSAPAEPETQDFATHPGVVKSPMVGTAYLAPAPGTANFVEIGKEVKEGQTIIIIEAMKTMNQIHAPRAGRVTHIFVENGQPVEYGEPLLVIE